MVEENWWMEEKAREGSRFIGGFGKRGGALSWNCWKLLPPNEKLKAAFLSCPDVAFISVATTPETQDLSSNQAS